MTGLVAPDVVYTMPEATLNAVADHWRIPDDSIHGTYDQWDTSANSPSTALITTTWCRSSKTRAWAPLRPSWTSSANEPLPRCTLGLRDRHAMTSPPGKRDSSQEGGPAPWMGRA